MQVSLNGRDWGHAVFPATIAARGGYTVLPSEAGSLLLHVIEDVIPGGEYGSLVKSNWNGTLFSEILPKVNQNRQGYVDLEILASINGTMLANVIDESGTGVGKSLVTMLSVDDGASWRKLKAPLLDSGRRKYDCGDSCDLHLHAFTERIDDRDMFSFNGAPGLVIGVGNVGSRLAEYASGDTFMSRDAGQTWTEIAKGPHMVEVTDHGGIIVLADDQSPSNSIMYSLDGGRSFWTHEINSIKEKILVRHMLTEQSIDTNQIILFGRTSKYTIAVNLDFSRVFSRKCELSKNDFESWTLDEQICYYGERQVFSRKKPLRECWVGDTLQLVKSEPCECSSIDFQCAPGFTMLNGNCQLQIDQAPLNPVCSDSILGLPTGYVKKAVSHCQGGLDRTTPINGTYCGNSVPVWLYLLALFLAAVFCGIIYLHKSKYDGYSSPNSRFNLDDDSTVSHIKRYANAAKEVCTEAGEAVLDRWFQFYNWIVPERRQHGYAPVSQFNMDSNGIRLDWEDEA